MKRVNLDSDSHATRAARRPARLLTGLLGTGTLIALSGCSGTVELDAEGARESFAERAEAAYADEGLSRDEDFQQGVLGDCFVLDEEAIEALNDAGIEGDLDGTPFLFGPPEETESLACRIVSGDQDGGVGILAARTRAATAAELLDARAELIEEYPESDFGVPDLDVEVDGLDPEGLVVSGDEEVTFATYVRDGFLVGLSSRTDLVDRDTLLEALPVLVEQVDRVLAED